MGFFAELFSSLLLFGLVFGMSATVDMRHMRKQIQNGRALLIGVGMQFLILPFIGFVVVKMLKLPAVTGITLLVVTSSPGGSYSNWWCSLFNAELALSVTMTAISTLLSTVMLPTNLIIYARWTYSSSVVKSLDWSALVVSLVIVIGAISCGIISSAQATKRRDIVFHRKANRLGNICGVSLIILSATVSSSSHETSLWTQDASFYIGVALPAVLGLLIATRLATYFDLEKPERVAVAVESCYQNTGIATSVALTMFSHNDDELATAIGVPLYYGIVEAVVLAIFCTVSWRRGWTKAPKDENFFLMLYNSYEVDEIEQKEEDVTIEVVLGSTNKDMDPGDIIFSQTDDGTYIVDQESLRRIHAKEARLHAHSMEDPTEWTAEFDDVSLECDDQQPVHPPEPPLGLQSSPTLSGSSASQEGDTEDLTHFDRAVAIIKARAIGYRKAPADPLQRRSQVPSIDESSKEVKPARIRSYVPLPFGSPTRPSHELEAGEADSPTKGREID